MPKCDYCGTQTKALHTGGDGGIPGDGVESGACSNCEPVLAQRGRDRANARRARKLAVVLSDMDAEDAADTAAVAPPAPTPTATKAAAGGKA